MIEIWMKNQLVFDNKRNIVNLSCPNVFTNNVRFTSIDGQHYTRVYIECRARQIKLVTINTLFSVVNISSFY